MKIDKIMYDGGEKGYQISIAETRRVVDLLEGSEEFDKAIRHLRKKYNFAENGFPIENINEFNLDAFFQEQAEMDKFFEEGIAITSELKLPRYWWSSIVYFAFYNVFFTPERVVLEVSLENKNSFNDGCHLVIKERISKTELHRLIDNEWEKIEDSLKLLHAPIKHKMLHAGIAKKIVKMKDIKKMKFREIADVLQKEYEESELYDSLNENNIKTLYHRWKARIKK